MDIPINREERLHMRQRGANTRKIQTADFAFSFGTPLQAQRSTSRTSHRRSRSVSLARSIDTPQPGGDVRQFSAPGSDRGSSRPSSSNSRGSSNRRTTLRPAELAQTPGQSSIANHEQARKDVDVEQGILAQSVHSSVPSVYVRDTENAIPSTRKRKRNADVPITIHEDPSVADATANPAIQISAAHELGLPVDKENAPPPDLPEGSLPVSKLILQVGPKQPKKRNKRKSIGQQRKKKRSSASSVESSAFEHSDLVYDEEQSARHESPALVAVGHTTDEDVIMHDNVDASAEEVPAEETSILTYQGSDENRPTMEGSDATQGEEVDETAESAEPSLPGSDHLPHDTATNSVRASRKTRRKRRSIGQGRKKRRSTDSLPPRRQTLDFEATHIADDSEDDNEFVPEELETSPIVETRKKSVPEPPVRRKRRAETLERVMPSVSSSSSTNEIVDTVPKDKRRRISKGAKTDKSTTRSNMLPFLVHRLTNIRALPTIFEETEEGSEAAGAAASDDEPTRYRPKLSSNPNSVDVIAQFCRETVETVIERLSAYQPADKSSRAALLRKQAAITSFGESLDARFFEMSQALDSKSMLEARLRKSKKEKATLQNEWLELRRQREAVAMRCDEVRRKNLEAERRAREAGELNEEVEALELSLERKPTDAGGGVADGLEFLLKKTADDVVGEQGGLLSRVKDFNGVLERMAGVLEGRN